MRDLSPFSLQNKGFVNCIYHVSKGSGVRQIGMGPLAKDKPTPRSGKTLYILGGNPYLRFLPSTLRHRDSADPPVVGVDLFDDHYGSFRVFFKDVHENLRHAADHLRLLLRCGPLPRDLDVHVGHPLLLLRIVRVRQTKRSSSPPPRRRASTRMRQTVPGPKTSLTGSPEERKNEAIAAMDGRWPTHNGRSPSLQPLRNARNISGVAFGARAAVSAIFPAGYPAASAHIAAVWIA